MPVRPATVAIVAYGAETKYKKLWQEKAAEMDFTDIDVRQYLSRDPATQVSHTENGTFESTQKNVFMQEGFANLMQVLIDTAWCTGRISLHCKAGLHRSDTAGRTLESVLNKLVDRDGTRLYNAKFFSLGGCKSVDVAKSVIEDVSTWSAQPWCVSTGGPVDETLLYGHTAAMSSARSAEAWRAVHNYADAEYENFADADTAPDNQPVSMRSKSVYPTDASVADADGEVEAADGSVPDEANNQEDTGGDGHGRDDSYVESTKGAADDTYAEEGEHSGSSSRDWWSSRGDGWSWSSGRWHDDGNRGSDYRDTKRARVDQSSDTPWVTFGADAYVWDSTMVEAGVDSTARKELFCLAQHSTRGWESANGVIAKLLKKQADGTTIRNPSGFVHACVNNARNDL